MHDQRTVLEFRVYAVRLWLVAAAAMIFLTLVVGGAIAVGSTSWLSQMSLWKMQSR